MYKFWQVRKFNLLSLITPKIFPENKLFSTWKQTSSLSQKFTKKNKIIR